MDTEQAAEVTSDHDWGEGETPLGNSEDHEIYMEEEEGDVSSSESSAEEVITEADMTHPGGCTAAQATSSPSPSMQTTRRRKRYRRKGRSKRPRR